MRNLTFSFNRGDKYHSFTLPEMLSVEDDSGGLVNQREIDSRRSKLIETVALRNGVANHADKDGFILGRAEVVPLKNGLFGLYAPVFYVSEDR